MLTTPSETLTRFVVFLEKPAVPSIQHSYYNDGSGATLITLESTAFQIDTRKAPLDL